MRLLATTVALMALASASAHAETAPEVGQPAPAFKTSDYNGNPLSLEQYKGKTVVLEWMNKDCPFVNKEYDSGTMQALQKQAKSEGVVWISIVSSAPGKEGYVDAAGANAMLTHWFAAPSALVLDPTGTLGHLYGAKTTPDMYVIDPQGTLVYEGAIDDKPSADVAAIAGAHNYVRAALDATEQGQPVPDPVTRPYGCGVKYAE